MTPSSCFHIRQVEWLLIFQKFTDFDIERKTSIIYNTILIISFKQTMSTTGYDELGRAKTQEKRLMEENRSLKRKLSGNVPANNSQEDPDERENHIQNAALQERKLVHLRELLEKVKNELTKEQEQRALQKKDFERKHAIVLKESAEFKNKFIVEKSFRQQKEEELKKLRNVKRTNEKINTEMDALNHKVQDLAGFKHFADKKMEEQSVALKSWEKQHIDLTEKFQEITATSSQYKYQINDLIQVNQKYQAEQEKCKKQDKDLKKHKTQGEAYRSQIRAFKIKNKELTTELKECSQSYTDLQDVVTKMRETEKNLTSNLEHQKNEAEKQRHLIVRMEEELNNLSSVKMKLQTKERDLAKHSLAKDEEVQYVRNLICHTEGKQRLLIIENEGLKDEKKRIQENLLKNQEELEENKIATRKLGEEIKILNSEADKKNEMLAKAQEKNNSLKKQLKKGNLQLAETKKMYEDLKKSEAFLLGSIKLNEVMAEKEKFEKEVQRCNGTIEQQQMRLNLQNAATASMEKVIQDSEDQVRFLQLENKRLKDEIHVNQSKKRQAKTFTFSDIQSKMKNVQWYFKKKSHGTLVLKKNEEIADLKRRLARRPDNAIIQLKQCQWDYRALTKKLNGVQGQLLAYQGLHQKLSDTNKELTCALRKKNLECRKKGTHLPPILKTPKPPTGGRPECSPDTNTNLIPMFPPLPPPRYNLVSRQTRFPIIRTI